MARSMGAWRDSNWLLLSPTNLRPTGWATKMSAISEHFRAGVTEREKCQAGSASCCATAWFETVTRSPSQWLTDVHLPKWVRKTPVFMGISGSSVSRSSVC